jgi:hypothetical protein
MTRTISRTCIAAMLSFGVTAYAQTTGQSPTQPTSQAGSQRMEQGRQAGDRSQTEQQITLVGCIQREAEFRQANQGGRGGTMGTGIGAGNEFVLINATSGSQTAMSGSTGGASGTMSGSATAGTSGTTASGTATTGSATGTTSGTGSTTGTGTSGTASGTTSGTGTTGSASGSSTTPGSTASHTQHSGMSVSSGGTAYALTGDREKDLEQYVGQRVEIVGRIEGGGANRSGAGVSGSGSGSGTTATGTASGTGSTSGTGTSATGTASGTTGSTTGSAGVETTTGTSATGSRTGSGTASAGSQGQSFGSLQQINIVSVRAVGGSCSAQ